MFTTPILFLVFNRPAATKKVFAQIRKIKPAFLYVAADGPRENIQGEKEICEEVRNLVLANIDWDCEIKTLFRNENLGCGRAVSQAITWFFEHVEEGIILEDDCLPDCSFFFYCQALLERYRHNDNIISISGTNFGYTFNNNQSYAYSRFMNMWGWATWRRSSLLIDYNMKNWKRIKFKKYFLFTRLNKYGSLDIKWLEYWKNYFDITSSGKLDTWDFQWIFTQLIERKIAIFPSGNLIKNIGFSENATHTTDPDHKIAGLEIKGVQFPLIPPLTIKTDEFYEEEYLKKVWCSHKNESIIYMIKTKLLYVPFIYRINEYLKKSRVKK